MADVKDVNASKQSIAKASLEDRASKWSRLTLSWFTRLMNTARHKILETEDIGQVSRVDRIRDELQKNDVSLGRRNMPQRVRRMLNLSTHGSNLSA